MNLDKLAAAFWRDGYLLLKDFFAPTLMDAYQQLIVEHFKNAPDFLHNEEFLQKSATDVIPWFPQQSGFDVFDIVEDNTNLQAITTAILGHGWNGLYCMTMFSGKGTKGQAWHQDCAPENPAKFNLNRLVYTDDINANSGGQVVVIPASHLKGEISIGDINEDLVDQLIIAPSKGDLLLLHGHVWHRVLPINKRFRVSTNYRCCPNGTPDDITNVCVYRNMRYRFDTSEVVENRLS